MHTDLITAKKNRSKKIFKKEKRKTTKRTLHIHGVPFALHFRRGAGSTQPPPSKPRAEPHHRRGHLNSALLSSHGTTSHGHSCRVLGRMRAEGSGQVST